MIAVAKLLDKRLHAGAGASAKKHPQKIAPSSSRGSLATSPVHSNHPSQELHALDVLRCQLRHDSADFRGIFRQKNGIILQILETPNTRSILALFGG